MPNFGFDPAALLFAAGSAGLSYSAAKKAAREREAAKARALAALEPGGEEASLLSLLRGGALQAYEGRLPPGLEMLRARQAAMTAGDIARAQKLGASNIARRYNLAGLRGSPAALAAAAGYEAQLGADIGRIGLGREAALYDVAEQERAAGRTMLQQIAERLAAERRARAAIEAGYQDTGAADLATASGGAFGAAIENLLADRARRRALEETEGLRGNSVLEEEEEGR